MVQMGPMSFGQPCQPCGGQGGGSSGCHECNFKKKKHEPLNLELKIPAGVENEATLVAGGMGEQPLKPDEEPGDLIFHIKIQDHPELMRQGKDLVWSTRISFTDSVNGKVIQVPHFDGPIEVNTSDWGILDPREEASGIFQRRVSTGTCQIQSFKTNIAIAIAADMPLIAA